MITASQLINFSVMSFTFVFFHRAVKAQGLNRDNFTFKSWFQPYTAIFGLISAFVMIWVGGYQVFLKGKWNIETFLFSYLAVFVDIILYIFWKLFKRCKWRKPEEVDLISGLKEIEDHEREYYQMLEEEKHNCPNKSVVKRVWESILGVLVGKDL